MTAPVVERWRRLGGSSATATACGWRYVLSEVDGWRPQRPAAPLAYGTAWHQVMEAVHRWWQDTGGRPWRQEYGAGCPWCEATGGADQSCRHCAGTGMGPMLRALVAWREDQRTAPVRDPRLDRSIEALPRALDGWLRTWGDRPPDGWRVRGVELPVRRPIVGPGSRSQYAPEAPVVREGGRSRLARSGEADGLHERWPWWLGGAVDVLWEDPFGSLWVEDHKSSADPRRWLLGQEVDPQVVRYASALRWTLDEGLLGRGGLTLLPGGADELGPGRRIAGWRHTVTGSRPLRDPVVLKDGGLSRAKQRLASVPSWVLADRVRQLDLPWSEWEELVELAVHRVDRRWFVREAVDWDPAVVARVEREAYADARRRTELHRAAARTDSPEDLAWLVPRVPHCQLRGCAWRRLCVDGDTVGLVQDWRDPEDDGDEDDEDDDEDDGGWP